MTKMLCRLLAGSVHAWVSAVCMYKKEKKKKKAFLWKEQRRAVWPPWKWMMHLFPAHPQPHRTCYLLYWRVRLWRTLGSSHFRFFFLPTLCRVHTDKSLLIGVGGGCEEGGLQFMAEESLDSKCIWKRGAESQTQRITEAPPSCWCSHFPWERRGSGSPSSSSAGHKRFVLATSKAPGHLFRVFLNSKVCKVVAENLGKALLGQLLLQSRMESHH